MSNKHNINVQSFWSKVLVKSNDECWEWQGHREKGYGRLTISRNGKNIHLFSHRLSYELTNSLSLTPDVIIRHSCDNPPCCNPAHLSTGTHADNQADKISRGREARGEANGQAKLTVEKVKAIREERTNGATYRELSDKYGVVISIIGYIVHRKIWTHVP
jgi:hypothetical protein